MLIYDNKQHIWDILTLYLESCLNQYKIKRQVEKVGGKEKG